MFSLTLLLSVGFALAARVSPSEMTLMHVTNVSPGCMLGACFSSIMACSSNSGCNEMAECIKTNLGSPQACRNYYSASNNMETSLINCAKSNSCMDVDESAAKGKKIAVSFAELDNEGPKVHAAEVAWKASRDRTDNMLAKLKQSMAQLDEELKDSAAKEKKQRDALEKDRESENEKLAATENHLKELEQEALKPRKSSFLERKRQQDIFAPLRKISEIAKKFAADVKTHAQDFVNLKNKTPQEIIASLTSMAKKADAAKKASLMETSTVAVPHSKLRETLAAEEKATQEKILHAEQELKNVDKELREQAEMMKHQADRPADAAGAKQVPAKAASLLQVNHHVAEPLSPEGLQQWKASFEEKLKKLEEEPVTEAPSNEDVEVKPSSFVQLSAKTEKLPSFSELSASFDELRDHAKEAEKEIPDKVALATAPAKEAPSSFVSLASNNDPDAALARAEGDLHKLQEELQSHSPGMMFGDTRRNVEHLVEQAKEAAAAPLPEEITEAAAEPTQPAFFDVQ